MKIELLPTLDLCIEGTARREYLKSVDEYMQQAKKSRKLEEKIELLRVFLETMDFRKLRAESEKYLIEGKNVRVHIDLRKRKTQVRNEGRVVTQNEFYHLWPGFIMATGQVTRLRHSIARRQNLLLRLHLLRIGGNCPSPDRAEGVREARRAEKGAARGQEYRG